MPTSASPIPIQLGNGLVTRRGPKFANFVVVDKSWKEKDDLQVLRTDDDDSDVYNYTGWRPGVDAKCEWKIKKGSLPANTLDVVTEALIVNFGTVQPIVNATVVIGPAATPITYKFVAALTGAADEVLIGATLLATVHNLAGAIIASATGGQAAGTTYGTGTVANLAASAVGKLGKTGYIVTLTQLALTETPNDNTMNVSGTAVCTLNDVTLSATPVQARSFVVLEKPETDGFGGTPLMQSVELAYHLGFTPVTVAP